MTPDSENEPIDLPLEGDSDEEFTLIEIKERVKQFLAENKGQRIPEELINEAVRWRLNRNDCQNRGYILDGYPKTYQQASNVFVITPKAPEKKATAEGEEEEEAPVDEEELAKLLKPQLQTGIYPESVIALQASELFLKRRSKQYADEKSKAAEKWDTKRLVEKLREYRQFNSVELFKQQNPGPDAIFPTTKFF